MEFLAARRQERVAPLDRDLLERGRPRAAALNVGLSAVLGVAAAWLGLALGEHL